MMLRAPAVTATPGEERSTGSGGRQIRRSVKWNAIGMAVSKSMSLVAKLVLARLLVPEHFGFVSMVLVFTQIVKVAADLGIGFALIQRRRDAVTRLLYDSAFWLLIGVAAALIAAMWLAGVPAIVWFYDEPKLAGVAMVMSLAIMLNNLQVVPAARLARTMRFKQIALAEFYGTALGCVTAIALALLGAGVWSLVAQILVSATATTIAMFVSAAWRPRLRFNKDALREVQNFSTYALGSRTLTHLQQNMDYLLLGKLLGAHAVGIYAIAFLVTETLRSQIYWVVAKVVFPVYSRANEQAAKIRTVYLGTIRYMTAIMFPVAMLFILFAGDAIPALFTEEWVAAVDPIRILAAASMVAAVAGTPGEVLRGVGKPNVEFRINLIVAALVALPALWVGIIWLGLPGAALAVVFHYAVSRTLFHFAIRAEIGLKGRQVLVAIRPALVGILLMIPARMLTADWHWVLGGLAVLLVYCAAAVPPIYLELRRLQEEQQPSNSRGSSRRPVVLILGTDEEGQIALARSLTKDARGGSQHLACGISLNEPWAVTAAHDLYALHLRCQGRLARLATGGLFWYLFFPIELVARRRAQPPRASNSILLLDRLPGRPFLRGGLLLRCYRLLLPRPDWAVVVLSATCPIERDAAGYEITSPDLAKCETMALRSGARECLWINTNEHDVQLSARQLLDKLHLARAVTGVAL